MKFKKVLALIMAATMVLTPMTALAEGEQGGDIAEDGGSGKIEAGNEMEGWVDTDVYLVSLPTYTEGTFDFNLDPQGLIGSSTGSETAGSGEFGSAGTGAVIFADDAFVTITNKSSCDIGVDLKVTLTSTDSKLALTASDAVEGDENRNIYMEVAPGTVSDDEFTATEGKGVALVAAEESDADTVVAKKKFAYVLPDASSEYELSGTTGAYEYKLKDSPDETAFKSVAFGFAGKINSKADWSAYATDTPLEMGLEISYSISKLGAEYDTYTAEASNMVDGVEGLLKDGTEEAPKVAKAPSAPAAANFTQTADEGATVYSTEIAKVSLGQNGAAGDLAATGIKTVTFMADGATKATTISAVTTAPTKATDIKYMYDAETDVLTLYGPVFVKTAEAGATGKLTITFNDSAVTVCTIALTVVDAE